MKINKQQTLNITYNKAFKFRFYTDSELKRLFEHYFGSARFVFNHTLSYSINQTDDYGDLIIIPNHQSKSLSSTDRINYIKELKINNP